MRLEDAREWHFPSIRSGRANFPFDTLSGESQLSRPLSLENFPIEQSRKAHIFQLAFVAPSAFRSSGARVLYLKEKLRTLRQSVENQPTCALHYEPENHRRCTTRVPYKKEKKTTQELGSAEKVIIEFAPAAKLKFIRGSYQRDASFETRTE